MIRDDHNACDDATFPAFPNWKRSAVVCVLITLAAMEIVRWVV